MKRKGRSELKSDDDNSKSPPRLRRKREATSTSPTQGEISNRDAMRLLSLGKERTKKKTENPSVSRHVTDFHSHDRVEGPPEIYLHRNPNGGIYVHEKDIETLFRFIDTGSQGRITLQDLKKKVGLFARDMTSRDFKFLMAGKSDMSVRELFDILKYNELDDFDPIAEAFKFYDPENTGYVDLERLREVFRMLGYGELSYSDMQILVECADADLDGKISLEDFRRLIPVYIPETPEQKSKNITIISDPAIHDQFVANLKDYGENRHTG